MQFGVYTNVIGNPNDHRANINQTTSRYDN